MRIRSIRHKGLRRFIEEDDTKGLRPDLVKRIRNILAAMISAPNIEGINGPPGWRLHQLIGDRAGSWSIATSGNWRITFSLDEGEIVDLDLEDYH
jgi:toxin HigB-1